MALVLLLVVPMLGGNRVAENRATCLSNLEQISKGLQGYLNDNGNRWPYVAKLATSQLATSQWPTLPLVLDRYVSGRKAIFHCPADLRTLTADNSLEDKFPSATTYFATEGCSYEWWFGEAYGGKKVGEESLGKAGGFGIGRSDQPLLSDFEPFHVGDEQGAINTLNADFKPRTSRSKAGKKK